MNEREKTFESQDQQPLANGGTAVLPERERADDLIAAGDDVIKAALSTNSKEYLDSNQQEGGQ